MYKILFLLVIISIFTLLIGKIPIVSKTFNTCLVQCPLNCNVCSMITYDINGKIKKKQMKYPCIFNGWNLSHVLLYMVLTVLFPKYYFLFFICGIIYEIGESIISLQNWLDILWNLIGISFGLLILKL